VNVSPSIVDNDHQQTSKVSDLEIFKQGNSFKIGYIDRQGTDQRIILTKHVEARSDMIKCDGNIVLPCKGRKFLGQICSSVIYTNGYHAMQEDNHYRCTRHDIEVPVIGSNPENFDEVRMTSRFVVEQVSTLFADKRQTTV
jgi:hypothetical protein